MSPTRTIYLGFSVWVLILYGAYLISKLSNWAQRRGWPWKGLW